METRSLGRGRPPPAARNHIVYTDHKGRKSDSDFSLRSRSPSPVPEPKKKAAKVNNKSSHSWYDSERCSPVPTEQKKKSNTNSEPSTKRKKTSSRIPYADKTTPEPILNNNAGRDTKADSMRNSYNSQFKVGIYGWRKKCLYILVMALMLMMIVNLALTLWVLKVLDFNSEGMGQLRIVPGGLQLLGQALVLDSLFASSIKSRRGQPITVESSRNFTVSTRDSEGLLQSRLFLGHDRVEVTAPRLEVRDARGALLLGAGGGAVTLGADTLALTSPAGATLSSAQTPLVSAPPAKRLTLESPTRSLEMHAPQGIALESRAGDISASCLTTFRLKSVAGSIRLDAPSIYMPKLKSALPLPPSAPHAHDPHHQNIYQLCACANGKLFLAPPHGVCAAREESLICR